MTMLDNNKVTCVNVVWVKGVFGKEQKPQYQKRF
jgi:hypothetical protein